MSGHSPGSGLGNTVMSIWFSPKMRPLGCLSATEYIAFVHYVVHMPSARLILEDVYKQLSLELNLVPGHVVLLLSIFASAAYKLEPKTAESLFLNQANAISCATIWTKAALNILEYSCRNPQGSIEDVQTTIISSSILFQCRRVSPRFRVMSSSALIMAKGLSLHRIDADISKRKQSRDGGHRYPQTVR